MKLICAPKGFGFKGSSDALDVACLSGCFPNVNLRSFPYCARQASISDIAAGLHAAFPG